MASSKSSKERRVSVMGFFSNLSNRTSVSSPSFPTPPLSPGPDIWGSEDKENDQPPQGHVPGEQQQQQQQQFYLQPPPPPLGNRTRQPSSSVVLVSRDDPVDGPHKPTALTDTSSSVGQHADIPRSHQRASTQPVLGETSTSLNKTAAAANAAAGADNENRLKKRSSIAVWPPRNSSPSLRTLFSSLKAKSPTTELPPSVQQPVATPPSPNNNRNSIARKPVPPHPREDRSISPTRRASTFASDSAPADGSEPVSSAPQLNFHSALGPYLSGSMAEQQQIVNRQRRASEGRIVRNFSHKSQVPDVPLGNQPLQQASPPPPPPKDGLSPSAAAAQSPKHKKLQPRPRNLSPSPARGRSVSAQPPAVAKITKARTEGPRSSQATPTASRHHSPTSSDGGHPVATAHSPSRGRLRRSWMPNNCPGDVSGSSHGASGLTGMAWIISPEGKPDYNTSYLSNGEKVPELWNEAGDVLVFLFPRASGKGPSFKVAGGVLTDSGVFDELLRAEMTSSPGSSRTRNSSFSGRSNLTAEDARRNTVASPSPPPGAENSVELCLYLTESPTVPKSLQDSPSLERLIDLRNLFAFLTGQPLVATREVSNLFQIFLRVASLLREFAYSSPDGMSFGKSVEFSMSFYAEQFAIADVRYSREKTVDCLMISEQMKSWEVYNEAFVHAVGKWEWIMALKSPVFTQLTQITRDRLERAHFDLESRRTNFCTRLDDMSFPGVFAGIANSTSNPDFRNVRFKNWKASFMNMRNFVIKYYKNLYGSWPPKARSKKNSFKEDGLNRLVLKQLYSDLCALYDLLVDREQMTTRMFNQATHDGPVDPAHAEVVALRKLLEEYDNSSPPVLPPIPFDVPKIPTMKTILETYDQLSAKEQTHIDRRVKSHELILIMRRSYNFDTDSLRHGFLDAFKQYDLSEAKGKTSSDLSDLRFGCWIFLYVVIQSLPMLAVDAPGVRFVDGVEYFLCMPPKGDPPWMEDGASVRKMWFKLVDQDTQVELSADAVLFSVEATYDRSHCWQAAKKWAEEAAAAAEGDGGGSIQSTVQPVPAPILSPLEPPRPGFSGMDGGGAGSPTMGTGTPASASPTASGVGSPMLRPRNQSPAGRSMANRTSGHWRSSIAFGLEPVDMDGAAAAPGGIGSPYSGSNRSLLNLHSPAMSTTDLDPASTPYSQQSPRRRMSRSQSAGNLESMAAQPRAANGKENSQSGSRVPSGVSGMSFDDILKGMEDKKTKKKKSWLPGS